jgi:hypothetical protein
MIFISSQQIDFYVPSTASPGTYTVQVFNDIYGSNVITYELDDTPGYWLLSNIYPEAITNSNNGGLAVNGPLRINNSALIGDIVFGSSTSNQSIKWSNITSSITADFNSVTVVDTVYITGDLNVSGSGYALSFNNVSDYRIKDIIEPLNSDLYSVDNLKPVKYFNKKSKKEEIGFLAHEVQESFPCLVTGKKDGEGLQTLNYIGLIGILTKEIQCLKADVAELKRNQK